MSLQVVVQDLDMTTGKKQAIGAFWGEVNSNCHRALGCIGTICDGAIRDVDEMTNAGFKALARRLCVGHAHGHPIAWGVPVTVFGTEVQPGQLIHADKHGFLCIPRSDELRVLDASLFCDQNECNTKIVATRGSIGCDFEEVCRRLAEADAAYGAANKAHFGVCPALDPLLLSPLGFGCWQLGTKADGYWGVDYTDELALEMITQAIDSGVTYFDTAEGYSDGASEAQLGRILKLLTPERRAKVVIGSKILPSNVADCRARLERSLGFLDILCIDLYMVHWPPSRDVSAEETTSTFMQLKQLQVEGKIRHIGVSNFGVSQMKLALATGVFITVNQLSFSLLFRAIEHEILPFCQANGIKTIAYSTLLQGVLAGKWADADSIPVTRTRSRHFSNARTGSRHTEAGHETLIFEALTTLKAIAAEVGVPLTTLALAYPRAKGLDCAIAGFTKTSHVEGNAASMAFVFDDALLARVDAATDAVKAAMGPNADMWDSGDAARIW
jgi:aryl-alcohol dehydrogenase-like predicted oxidoreductase|tara:strand:- start:4191 stop:5687 length:1497 start_codon:yes stop_codon:yes gene_type:complete